MEAEQEKFILGVTPSSRCYDVSDENQEQQKASQALEYFIVKVNNIHLNQLQQQPPEQQSENTEKVASSSANEVKTQQS